MGKKTSASDKAAHGRYKADNHFAKNKAEKLKRHLKQFPNDEIAQAALKNVSTAKSSRFGKKAGNTVRRHIDRVTDPIYAHVRASNRAYLTVKDGDSLILDGVIYTPEMLKEYFNYAKKEQKEKKESK